MKTFNLFITLVLVGFLLALGAGGTVAHGPVSEGLVLWNKLGSEYEVLHSEIGPSFNTRPGVIYVAGRCGDALATTGGENGGGGYLTMSPDDFFPADKTRGTVEVWIQKRIDRFIPFETPLVGIFGWQPYAYFDPTEGYKAIMAFWSDGYTGGGGMQFQIRDSNGDDHVANDLGWDDVPVGEWVHMAFVWDLAGIQGSSDKMRIYRDGAVVAANADDILGIMSQTDEVRILGHHAYSRFGQPTAYLDNIMVWNYAKTDFSDLCPTLTVIKVVVNGKGGSAEVDDFTLYVGDTQVTSGETNSFDVGSYTVTEDGPSNYAASFSGDCDVNGSVTLALGDDKTCTLTNTYEKPTAVTLASFSAQAGDDGVTLAWETAMEVDNAGFNLYRALLQDGPYTQVNGALISAQGGSVSGASYSFVDTPDYGTYYYKLEDVDYNGVSAMHGPVKVTVARPLLCPLYRPTPPQF